ncbi:MAG TPA: tRNA-dihydrouridine synthase, partial [Polyangiaceae bacterium]|nr:tRNA-dihydrouridine synthase [Polyangiaceae bacterium]
LGRPWLFRDLAAAFDGAPPPPQPRLGEIADVMREHARRLADWFGEGPALRSFRRHATWYTKGFRGSARMRERFMELSTLEGLEAALADIDPNEPFPPHSLRVSRGKRSGTQSVSLPPGYLDHRDDAVPPVAEAEDAASGG